MFLQQTIRKKVTISGIGLHTGAEAQISFCPAPPNTGVHFVRRDLPGCPSIAVHAKYVSATSYATTLGNDHFAVSTVEHCLSSVTALQIDNLFIELNGPEIPICDGSALVFLQELLKVGVVEQEMPRQYIFVTQPIYVGNNEKHAYVVPYNGLRITCTIDFPHPKIGQQKLDIDVNVTNFERDIAPARTFGFLRDVEALRARGLARGGTLENAIVLDDDNIMNPNGLRFKDEFVRHKVLDAIGDLVTLGHPLLGHLVLFKAGHDLMNQLNAEILRSTDKMRLLDLGKETPQVPPYQLPFAPLN
ncbi:MAG: UDP-3-O-acyl-N-acetylglucosamine deacetylase [Bdellovibrionaceae bacterium]|nr:UDP-3-O-acyl-N-acetylglucosamine deacetylase [Pseudobdellovibrionaceae bacterium]